MLKQLFAITAVGCTSLAVLSFIGCAKQEYRKEQYVTNGAAVGFRYLPAKVDILMVPDNTGSTNSIFGQLQGQLSSFVSGMQDKFWDYHVGRSPIYYPSGAAKTITRVLVNGKFNTPYLEDGTTVTSGGIVPSDRAETNPNNFPILENVFATGAGDDGYANTIAALSNAKSDAHTNFLRSDALLAIVVITNGYDRNVTDATGSYTSNGSQSLNSYANQLINIKGSSRLIRFYPVAAYGYADGTSNYCLAPGGTSRPGWSYLNMNGLLQGISANVCDAGAMSNVLANIEENLNAVRQAYVYSNIVLEEEPKEDSIEVYKNGTMLSQSPTNGWQYKGKGTVATVSGICDPTVHTNNDTSGICKDDHGKPGTIVPVQLSSRTGYVIQLNGSARLLGSDSPDLIYEKR